MKLRSGQKEVLSRLLEVGVTRSAELLGKMSRTKWSVVASSVSEIPVVRLLTWFQRDGGRYLGARFISHDPLSLRFLVIFPDRSSKAVTASVTRPYAGKMRDFPDIVRSTIGEVSNILAQGIVGAVADEFGAKVIFSSPEVNDGTKTNLFAGVLGDYDARKDMLMMAQIDMCSEDLTAECSVIMIAGVESLQRLLAN